MWNTIASVVLPPLLVFGLYHLMVWFNVFRINSQAHWKKVALTSLIAHVLLAAGFFIFSWADYISHRELSVRGTSYGEFLFNHSEFWRLMTWFDTLPMIAILALFWLLARLGMAAPGAVGITVTITLVLGSAQWYFVGGGVGALLERFWSGLKTTDPDDEWFQ